MIGKIEEVARGGGSEFLLAFALWFGVINNAFVSMYEVAIGIISGGGGTQRLLSMVG
jgi:enoyl-CoA hydratase/carnithine racemase